MLALTAQMPDRANFQLTPSEVLGLPVRIRDKMLKQLKEWRAQEDAAFAKLKRR